jgi:drug/metabolite transporter (DMT)-like permease
VTGQFPTVTTASVIGLLYQSLVTSVLCIFLSFYAVKVIGATATTIVLFVQPLFGALIGVTMLGDPITSSGIIGAVCVFGSIAMSMRSQLREVQQ